MEKKELVIEAVKGGAAEIIIREGEAKKLLAEVAEKEVKPLFISGSGGTCKDFLKYRKDLYNPKNCYGHVGLESSTIKLTLNECQADNKNTDVVISKYPVNKKVTDLQMNTGFGRNSKELYSLLRLYKIYAANKETFQLLLNSLTQFSAKVQAEINKSDDRGGNSNNGIVKKITHSVPENFILNIPIIGNKIVSLLINIELNSNSEQFELWSDDFIEKFNSEINDGMTAEIAEIEKFCLVVYC